MNICDEDLKELKKAYSNLGLEFGASEEAYRARFRELSLEFISGRAQAAPGRSLEEQFELINDAKEFLDVFFFETRG